jgi:hypothetical protein
MSEVFRLLRNNKETGPYSLDELLQQSLRPYDLVWVEGKGAGWRYPSELDILKPYLQENIADISGSINTSVVEKQIPSTLDAVSKPAQISVIESDTLTEEEELTAEALDKKANEIYLRVQAYSSQKEKQANYPQTKHARSLDELKQEYADWLHKKNHKNRYGKKLHYILPAVAIVLVGFIGFVVINKNNSTEVVPVKHNYYLSHAVEKPGDYTKQKNTRSSISTTSQSFAKAPVQKQSTVEEFLDSVKRELAKQDARLQNASIANYNKAVRKKDPFVSNEQVKSIQQNNGVEIASLIKVAGNYKQDRFNKISSLEITINNTSTEFLNKVAVNIFYYKQNDRLFDKETVYFTNIQPGGSFTLNTSGNRKASSARFELGKIN